MIVYAHFEICQDKKNYDTMKTDKILISLCDVFLFLALSCHHFTVYYYY